MSVPFFIETLNRILRRRCDVLQLVGAAERLAGVDNGELSRLLYQTWIEINPNDPLIHLVNFNLSLALVNAGDLEGAKAALQAAIKVSPQFHAAHINLGFVYERQGLAGEAVSQWNQVVATLEPVTRDAIGHKALALKQIGRMFKAAGQLASAEQALRQCLALDPEQRDVLQHWISLRQQLCRWPTLVPLEAMDRKRILRGISPLSVGSHTDDPMFQLAVAADSIRVEVGLPDKSFAAVHERRRATDPNRERLKIGYLSSDFREHAVGYLAADVLGLHDRSKVEVFAYYSFEKPASTDLLFHNFQVTADHWTDLHGLTDDAAAARIVADGIDILVDLNGHTMGSRTRMLAMRPAPIIANWLGFPGSAGSPFHHYIIADEFIIPPTCERYYTEKVVRLPCYQPSQRRRAVAERPLSRSEAGLPEHGMVYCSFNSIHKCTPFTWGRWMEILERVPDSVLWLLTAADDAKTTLRSLAQQRGINPDRLVFAPRVPNPDHLARYRLADLFLDSTPYGAHTTGSDSLWMGVPVLTLAGRSFASRVCGSLLRAAGLPELICTSPQEYVERAVALGRNRQRCAGYRQFLLDNRDRCVLFDTPLLVARLEDLYQQMWGEWRDGRLPVPDLSNLDLYLEIGTELDRDAVELQAVNDYEQLYRNELMRRHAFRPIPPDQRLWSRPELLPG